MKLYFSPGACSLSPHIILHEAGLTHSTAKVDLRAKTTSEGKDYRTINPKGYVPALELDSGQVLTEGPAIVQYLADLAPGKNLAPANGTLERYQLQSWLNFVGTEIHKNYSPLFNPESSDDVKRMALGNLAKRYDYLNQELGQRDYVFGSSFTVADAYLFVVTNWAGMVKFDLSKYPNVEAFQKRISERESVQKALRHEGLLQ